MEKQNVSDKLARFIQRNMERYSPSYWAVAERHGFDFFPQLTTKDLVYICPLCRVHRIFQKNNELYWTKEFTMDHYPPASVGGKNKALVCSDCNSSLGSSVDSHLPNGLRAGSFFGQKGSMPITLSVNKTGNYKLNGSIEDGKISLTENNKNSNLVHLIKKAAEKMMTSGEPFVVNMKGSFPSSSLMAKTLLKAAFLQFFT